MGNMVRHLGNSTSTTVSMHHFGDLWKSPRGTVLRIQALTVVAIIISFFLAAFGTCRRWSNRWIVQKGFFIAHALSLSLGTYSIGLMQSSPVKSEMYPIWTVSLFSLFVCIDPITAYNGHDYKGPLSKMVYGICLNFGYVLLMSMSTTSNNGVCRLSIIMLTAITFIKGFHGSLSLAQQSRMRKMLLQEDNKDGCVGVLRHDSSQRGSNYINHPYGEMIGESVSMAELDTLLLKVKDDELSSCHNVCVALCLSRDLQQHFLGLGYGTRTPNPSALTDINYKWALEVIEIELAFVFEVFFTGNSFFHYYQAKTSSLWALASFIGICFVGVETAISAETTRTNNNSSIGACGCIKAVDTTTADLVMTFFILASLGLLQLMHLIRCWTSNWARVAIACAYATNNSKEEVCKYSGAGYKTPYWRAWWMRLKALVATSTNWFDKNLWQNKIGQYSMLPEWRLTDEEGGKGGSTDEEEKKVEGRCRIVPIVYKYRKVARVYGKCVSLFKSGYKTLGVDYVWVVLFDLLGNDTNKKGAIRLEDEVKESVVDFLGKIQSDRLDMIWLSSSLSHPTIQSCLPYSKDVSNRIHEQSHAYRYARCVMMWHTATWFCELLAEQEQEKQDDAGAGCCLKKAAAERDENNRNRRVANALSKYCVHLVVLAPELLPGPISETAKAYIEFVGEHRRNLLWDKNKILAAMSDLNTSTYLEFDREDYGLLFASAFADVTSPTQVVFGGLCLAKVLLGDHPPLHGATRCSVPWETLMHVWVRLLVYAAPYGNVDAHMRRLPQGGEFITHLWALLYHIDIREWKFKENLHNLATTEDLEKILKENDHAAVICFGYYYVVKEHRYDEVLAAASRMEDGVSFYQISDYNLAMFFSILTGLMLMNKQVVFVNKEKITLYDGDSNSAYDIARFVTTNKLALAKTREDSTDVSASRQAQSSKDGGQIEDKIEEEGSDDGRILDRARITQQRSFPSSDIAATWDGFPLVLCQASGLLSGGGRGRRRRGGRGQGGLRWPSLLNPWTWSIHKWPRSTLGDPRGPPPRTGLSPSPQQALVTGMPLPGAYYPPAPAAYHLAPTQAPPPAWSPRDPQSLANAFSTVTLTQPPSSSNRVVDSGATSHIASNPGRGSIETTCHVLDGNFNSAHDIARFVNANKLALAKTREESTDVSASHRAQSSEDGGQIEDEIQEECFDGEGQTKDETEEEAAANGPILETGEEISHGGGQARGEMVTGQANNKKQTKKRKLLNTCWS